MPVPKKILDLREYYSLYIEIGLILALSLLIVATRVDLPTQQRFEVRLEEQSIVELKDILQTEQNVEPPPPPRPPVPLEVPNSEVIEEKFDFDASLDLTETITPTLPPSPPEDPEETFEEETIFVVVEEKPQIVGGLKALHESIEYPEFARQAGIEGRVIVQFVVDQNGNVQDLVILQGAHSLLNEEALRVIKAQRFLPGKQRDKPVKVRMALPVTFRLQS